MKTLPPPAEMYRALLARDATYDGSFFAAIRTTGIFCRPGCGAKKPLRENVEFFATAGDAERAGFRPCLRCRPLEPALATPAWANRLLALADGAREERLSSEDLRRAGIDPGRAARWCRERYGMTFQAWMRSRRLIGALDRIRGGAAVTDAAMSSGFESESGFRDAFVKLFGVSPSRAASEGTGALRVAWIGTPLGPMLAAAGDEGLALLEFADRRALGTQIAALRRHFPRPVLPGSHAHLEQIEAELGEYFAGERSRFDVEILVRGTPFQSAVWDRLRRIPPGETRSYADIARELGRPDAVRAVARANGDNRLAIVIPCHRVVGSDGSPTGYGGGIWRKNWLLAHEQEARTPAGISAPR